jgi:phage terminase large subunit
MEKIISILNLNPYTVRKHFQLDILKTLTPLQIRVLKAQGDYQALLAPRGSGKTMGLVAKSIFQARERGNQNILYVSKTLKQATPVMFRYLKRFNAMLNLDLNFRISVPEVLFPNGSSITIAGADSKDGHDKIRGERYHLIIVDECGHWNSDFDYFLFEVLDGCTLGTHGKILLVGTPRGIPFGIFYEVTKDGSEIKGWNVLLCNDPYDNPYTAEDVKKKLEQRVLLDPTFMTSPAYYREYEGRWVSDLQDQIYQYSERNFAPEPEHTATTLYILGVDWGYSDATGFVLSSTDIENRNYLYIHESFQQDKLLPSQIFEIITKFKKKFPNFLVVADNNRPDLIAQGQMEYMLPIVGTKKSGIKVDSIQLMNSDFSAPRIFLNKEKTQELQSQYSKSRWLDRIPGRIPKEDPNVDNHCSDASLYVHRHAYHYLHKDVVHSIPVKGSQEWFEQEDAKYILRFKEQLYTPKGMQIYDFTR